LPNNSLYYCIYFSQESTTATECSEQEFFYDKESGGTKVSSALELTANIIQDRYAGDQYNIYIAQASDGDNWGDDNSICRSLIVNKLLPFAQYFAYIEITDSSTQHLWDTYKKISMDEEKFQIRQVRSASEVYPVFRSLFEQDGSNKGITS
jgi:uncharacterized sporulation protein YeaH/YhbH (DUF444 family)